MNNILEYLLAFLGGFLAGIICYAIDRYRTQKEIEYYEGNKESDKFNP